MAQQHDYHPQAQEQLPQGPIFHEELDHRFKSSMSDVKPPSLASPVSGVRTENYAANTLKRPGNGEHVPTQAPEHVQPVVYYHQFSTNTIPYGNQLPPAPATTTAVSQIKSGPLPPQAQFINMQGPLQPPTSGNTPSLRMIYTQGPNMIPPPGSATPSTATTANSSLPSAPPMTPEDVEISPDGSGLVPRLPPIMQVEKAQVTTTATQAASASRRRNEAHFVCPVPGCGSTFTRRFNLRGHLRSHTEERPYICEWPGCGKGFARAHDCKRHQSLHAQRTQANTCHGCKKTFSRLDALNRHLRSDGGKDCRSIHTSVVDAAAATMAATIDDFDVAETPADGDIEADLDDDALTPPPPSDITATGPHPGFHPAEDQPGSIETNRNLG